MSSITPANQDTSAYNVICTLAQLNNSVSSSNLEIMKVVARHALGIAQQKLDKVTQLTGLFNLIEMKYPPLKTALQLLLFVLQRLDLPFCDLQSYLLAEQDHEPCDIHVQCYKSMDFILTVSSILCNLTEKKYKSLQEIARRVYFNMYDPSNITSRVHLLCMLLDQDIITPDKFGVIFAWLEVIDCTAQQADLRKYCRRNKIVEPEWRSFVLRLQETFPYFKDDQSYPASQSCTDDLVHSLPKSSTHREDSSLQHTASTQGLHHFQAGSGSLSTSISSNEFMSGSICPQQPIDGSGSNDMVTGVCNTKVSLNVVSGIQKERNEVAADGHNKPSETEVIKDVAHNPPVVLRYPLLETQIEEGNPSCQHRHYSVPSCGKEKEDISINNDNVIDVASVNEYYSRINNKRNNFGVKIVQMLSKRPCILLLLILLTVFAVFVLSSITTGLTIYFKHSCLSSYNTSVGSNTTVLVGGNKCFDPTHIRSLTVTSLSSGSEVNFFLTKDYPLVTRITLPSKTSPINETAGGNNIELNYYSGNSIYTAGPGTLTYNLQLLYLLQDYFHDMCPFIYLFDSNYYYNKFIGQSYTDSVTGYIQNYSLCFSMKDARDSPLNQVLNLSLPQIGFYYVGVSVPEGVAIGVKIIPKLANFDISHYTPQPCSLSANSRSCQFQLSKKKVPSSSLQTCLLASTTAIELCTVTLGFEQVHWNLKSVLSLGIGCGILVLCSVCFCCFLCRYTCTSRRKHSDYISLE